MICVPGGSVWIVACCWPTLIVVGVPIWMFCRPWRPCRFCRELAWMICTLPRPGMFWIGIPWMLPRPGTYWKITQINKNTQSKTNDPHLNDVALLPNMLCLKVCQTRGRNDSYLLSVGTRQSDLLRLDLLGSCLLSLSLLGRVGCSIGSVCRVDDGRLIGVCRRLLRQLVRGNLNLLQLAVGGQDLSHLWLRWHLNLMRHWLLKDKE